MKLSKENLVVQVGSNIRQIRKKKGFTIENLANLAEIDSRQLRRIELGQINTSIYQIYQISITLDVHIHEFFNF